LKLLKERLYEEWFKYFKGPSKERILKNLEGKSLKMKFILALQNNVPWLVKDCIKEGADPTIYNNSPIIEASRDGFEKIVKILLKDKRVDPTIDNNRPILLAYLHDHYKIVKLLLDDNRVYYSLSIENKSCYNVYLQKMKKLKKI
jgi:hypothetical protein